jgi:hypothetical protein
MDIIDQYDRSLTMKATYRSKKQAIKALKIERVKNPSAKLIRVEGVYTQPGRGIVAVLEWYIR